MSFVLAIDGTAGSGKGTVSDLISRKLNFINVDTGAMYRCVTLKALRDNIKTDEIEKLKDMLEKVNIEIKINNGEQRFFLDGEDVSKEIRQPIIDDNVAQYSSVPCVREKMTPMQRKMGEKNNIVMEGRDIGTVVFPDANLKIYLDATIEERARRRYEQNKEKGMEISYEEVLEALKERHKIETQREIAPLRQAEDAIYIDTTNITAEGVADKIIQLVQERYSK